MRLIDAGGLDDAAVLGDVAVEHGQAAVLGIGVRLVADAAVGAVEVELG
jgi:glutamate/tyrosine decarboxylase-like PLP-dependent enzyme